MMAQTITGVKLVLSDPQVFSECIGAVSKLVDEATIKATPTHIEITAMDPANVALISFRMESRAFLEYSISEDTSFAIKLGSLKQVLSRREKDGTVSLAVDNNQLKIVLNGKSRKEFILPLIELEEKQQKMPELKFGFEVILDNAEFREAVADVAIVAESCEFRIADKKFVVSGAGDSSRAVSDTKGVVKELGEDKTAKAKYGIEYLDKMLGTKLSKNAKLYLAKDYPMKLSYVSDNGTVSIEYLLAPRIEND